MWVSGLDDCARPSGRYNGVMERCLLHRSAVYHIGLCAYVRANFNMGCRQNTGGSNSLFAWVCTCPTTHYTWISPGKPAQAVPRSFLLVSLTCKGTRAGRKPPLVSTKCTSKTVVHVCARACTYTHTELLWRCARVQQVSGIRHQTRTYWPLNRRQSVLPSS